MKKNLIIVVLTIISIASIIYGYTQKQKADEQEALAKEYSIVADEERRRAEIQAEMALEQRRQAELAVEKAIEQLLPAYENIKGKQNEAE